MKKPKPAIGQMWSFSSISGGNICEIVLLTRVDNCSNCCYGILLFQINEDFDNLIGKEVGVGILQEMISDNKWCRVS